MTLACSGGVVPADWASIQSGMRRSHACVLRVPSLRMPVSSPRTRSPETHPPCARPDRGASAGCAVIAPLTPGGSQYTEAGPRTLTPLPFRAKREQPTTYDMTRWRLRLPHRASLSNPRWILLGWAGLALMAVSCTPLASVSPLGAGKGAAGTSIHAVATSRLFGLSSPGSDGGLKAAQKTAGEVGRRLDVVNFYEAWGWKTSFPVTRVSAIAAAGARAEITWEPWYPPGGSAPQPAYSLRRIAAGGLDGYIKSWATSAAAYGKPLFLRFAHEMNGHSYPWTPAKGGGSPADYVNAYRHIHDVFVAAGATNVSWVWSPLGIRGAPTR